MIVCPTVLKIELFFNIQTGNQAGVHYTTLRPLSFGFCWGDSPSFPISTIIFGHSQEAFGFIKARLACILYLCSWGFFSPLPTNSFPSSWGCIKLCRVITLLSHEQHGKEYAVQLSCSILVMVSTCSNTSPS